MLLIAKRDYLATIRTRAFLVGLFVAPLLFGGGFLGLALMRVKPDLQDRRIAIVDRTGIVADVIISAAREKSEKELRDKSGRQVSPRYLFESVKPGTISPDQLRLQLSDRVRRGDLYAFIELGAGVLHPSANEAQSRIAYYTNAGGIDQVRNWLNGPINDGLRFARLSESGIDPKQVRDLSAWIPLETMSLVSKDAKTGRIEEAHKKGDFESFVIPYSVALLLAMMVMMGSSPMLTGVTHDKTQRIVEMMLGVATPLELMGGKVMAAIGASLTSSSFYVISGFFALEGMGLTALLPSNVIFWFYAYLLADMLMLCALAAAFGAMCSTPQEAQSLSILVIAPVIIPLFVLVPVMSQPSGIVATALSLFPPFTPVLMLVRQALPSGVPAWQPWVGLTGVLICAAAIVFAASRIFRIGIMLQGKPPKAAEMIRWAIRG